MMECSKIQIYKKIYINFTHKHNNFQNKQNQTKDEYIYRQYLSLNQRHRQRYKYIQWIDHVDRHTFH